MPEDLKIFQFWIGRLVVELSPGNNGPLFPFRILLGVRQIYPAVLTELGMKDNIAQPALPSLGDLRYT